MQEAAIIAVILIVINGIVSYLGIKNSSFLDKYAFHVDRILIQKQYFRLITSGFLHGGWVHLAMNMWALYIFTERLVPIIGVVPFFVIYFGSLIGGNLLALFIHRNHGDYRAVGASGAVSGLVFAFIALLPDQPLGIMFIPVAIPGWIFGVIYILYTIYGIKSDKDNIGHEAHLGGGVIGMIIMIVFQPYLLKSNYLPIGLMLIPTFIFLILIVKRPELLFLNLSFKKSKPIDSIDHQFNANKVSKENELNQLLDKISDQGIDQLTEREKTRLEELSR